MKIARGIDRPKIKKADIQKIIKSLKRYWSRTKKDAFKNRRYLAALALMNMGIVTTNDETVENLWFKMMLAVEAMVQAGMAETLRKDGFPAVADHICRKIESGELFADLPDD